MAAFSNSAALFSTPKKNNVHSKCNQKSVRMALSEPPRNEFELAQLSLQNATSPEAVKDIINALKIRRDELTSKYKEISAAIVQTGSNQEEQDSFLAKIGESLVYPFTKPDDNYPFIPPSGYTMDPYKKK